jgi:tubulin-folding cofactor B
MRCKSIEYGHRGEVKYVGKIPELGLGWYVGIRLDEPFGKSDGT